jgi:hypothetical protein
MRSTAFKSIVAPLLNESFNGVYEQRAREHEEYMDVAPGIKRNYHEDVLLYGFPLAPELPDGTPVEYRSGGELYRAVYPYKVYGLAFALTKVLVEDGDHVRLGPTFAEHLAQSLTETTETVCANVLNVAFNASFPIGDGQPLVSTSHVDAIGSVPNQPSTSNLIAPAALSQTSLEAGLIQVRKASDATGRRIRLPPRQLLIPPDLEFTAEVILKSVLRTGGTFAVNDINPVKSMGLLSQGAVVVTRMTSAINWFIQTDAKRGIRLMTRRDMEKSMEGDFETDSMRYKATMRWSAGATDWRNIWGNAGA